MAFPRINSIAPTFSGVAVRNEQFAEINSTQFIGKYLVLFFYPMDFTFVCPTELTMLSDRIDEFKEVNCEIVGVSTDSQFSHYTWLQIPRSEGGLGKLAFPLLADKSAKIARAYGVFNEVTGLAYRGLFIIDGKGLVRQITINDLAVGRSIDEILRLVKAFQFSDENGEACPANWKPGERTIKPDPIESKLYFINTIKKQEAIADKLQQSSNISNKTDNQSKLDVYSVSEDATSYSTQQKSAIFSMSASETASKKIEEITSNIGKIPGPLTVESKKPETKKSGVMKSSISTVEPPESQKQ